MPGDEYFSAVGGGLKLKGVHGSKVDKHKKKRKKNKEVSTDPKDEQDSPARKELDKDQAVDEGTSHKREQGREEKACLDELSTPPSIALKTEAERRHEEQRRKRLEDRLKREGVKTHKERVEDYNRYLSSLSEHHDMPRIGPG